LSKCLPIEIAVPPRDVSCVVRAGSIGTGRLLGNPVNVDTLQFAKQV